MSYDIFANNYLFIISGAYQRITIYHRKGVDVLADVAIFVQ